MRTEEDQQQKTTHTNTQLLLDDLIVHDFNKKDWLAHEQKKKMNTNVYVKKLE